MCIKEKYSYCTIFKRLYLIFLLATLFILSCENNQETGIKLSPPVISPSSTVFISDLTVRIDSDSPHTRIMYTLDGSEPTTNSILYSGFIIISETTTLKARSFRSKYDPSDIVEAHYTFNQVQAPIFSLESGTYYEPYEISIRTTTAQAEIYYTINGTEPIMHPMFLYEEPFNLPDYYVNGQPILQVRVQAKAFRTGWAPSITVVQTYDFRVSRMIFVQGGSFHPNNETIISLSDFYMSNYLITQLEWQTVMEGNNNGISANPSLAFQDINNPVDNINWYEAIVYCNRRSVLEGLQPVYFKNGISNTNVWGYIPNNNDEEWDSIIQDISLSGYRLPTEMEWWFAARGGNTNRNYLYSGGNLINEVAWFIDNSSGQTHPVGDKKPNELGLYDMSGNLWEWCWDWYSPYVPTGSIRDYTGPESGVFRILRGGSYNHNDRSAEVSYREGRGNSWYNESTRGFRVVLGL